MFTWDERKRQSNIRKHGMDLADVAKFEFETAIARVDDSFDYGEERWVALGFVGTTLCVLVYTDDGENIHAISLRKATKRETKIYDEEIS